jgi:hypothetical protein
MTAPRRGSHRSSFAGEANNSLGRAATCGCRTARTGLFSRVRALNRLTICASGCEAHHDLVFARARETTHGQTRVNPWTSPLIDAGPVALVSSRLMNSKRPLRREAAPSLRRAPPRRAAGVLTVSARCAAAPASGRDRCRRPCRRARPHPAPFQLVGALIVYCADLLFAPISVAVTHAMLGPPRACV